MNRFALFFLLVSLLTGCATTRSKENAGFLERYSESKRLSAAVAQLEKGDHAAAVKTLEAICNAKPVPGVTDEALFRLALLTLKPSPERPASPQGSALLRRLKREFPSSQWAAQATPLVELVNAAEELRRQNRNFRTANQSLTREVNELNKTLSERNKTIEQLKHLDLEMEQKTR